MTTAAYAATDEVTSTLTFYCSKARFYSDQGNSEGSREAIDKALSALSGDAAGQAVSDYVTVANTVHLTKDRVNVELLDICALGWALPDRYWDVLSSDVAAPAGSHVARVLYRHGAAAGHARSIALTFALNGVGVSNSATLAHEVRQLRRQPESVRRTAGLLAPTWSGTFADLITAAIESGGN